MTENAYDALDDNMSNVAMRDDDVKRKVKQAATKSLPHRILEKAATLGRRSQERGASGTTDKAAPDDLDKVSAQDKNIFFTCSVRS